MKVCLIGNNLTSLILANILSKKNILVEIYSLKSKIFNFETRTLGITDFNLNYLNKFFKKLPKKMQPINEISVLIKNKKVNEQILFKKDSKSLFNMAQYNHLIAFFKSQTNFNKRISMRYFKAKSDLLSFVDNKKFNLIINCESNNILTKKFLKKGISKNYYNKAFTSIITHKKIKNNKAIQIFTEYGPIAYLPLSMRHTSIVFSCEVNKLKDYSESQILEFIKKFNPGFKILSHKKLKSFDLNLKLAKKYYYKNILFFGDSIHSIHPLAGQGFNMTIRDIIELEKIIDKKINLGLSVDNSIYKDFEKNSKGRNTLFSFGVDFIYEFFRFNKNYIPNKISKSIFNYINKNKKIKDWSLKFANQGFL